MLGHNSEVKVHKQRATSWLFFHKGLAFSLAMHPLTSIFDIEIGFDEISAEADPEEHWNSRKYRYLLNRMACGRNASFKELLEEHAIIAILFRNSYSIVCSSWKSHSCIFETP